MTTPVPSMDKIIVLVGYRGLTKFSGSGNSAGFV